MTLRKMCSLLGWKCRRWKEMVSKVKELQSDKPDLLETPKPVEISKPEIEWPQEWNDRGAIRKISDKRNYPDAGPGIVYTWQIAEYLGGINSYKERVLNFHLYRKADGTRLSKSILKRDRYDSYYCAEDHAREIVEVINLFKTTTKIV